MEEIHDVYKETHGLCMVCGKFVRIKINNCFDKRGHASGYLPCFGIGRSNIEMENIIRWFDIVVKNEVLYKRIYNCVGIDDIGRDSLMEEFDLKDNYMELKKSYSSGLAWLLRLKYNPAHQWH